MKSLKIFTDLLDDCRLGATEVDIKPLSLKAYIYLGDFLTDLVKFEYLRLSKRSLSCRSFIL